MRLQMAGLTFDVDQTVVRGKPDDGKFAVFHLRKDGCVQAVEAVNYDQKNRMFELIARHFGGELRGKTIALWGLAFKPNTDDMREAPSREIIADLLARGATVRAYDPVAMEEAHRIFGDEPRLSFATGTMDALGEHGRAITYSLSDEPTSGFGWQSERGFENYLVQLDEVLTTTRAVRLSAFPDDALRPASPLDAKLEALRTATGLRLWAEVACALDTSSPFRKEPNVLFR